MRILSQNADTDVGSSEPSPKSPTGAEAVVLWCSMLAKCPRDDAAVIGLAEALYGLSAPGPAAAILIDLIERNAGRADPLLTAAKIIEGARDWDPLIRIRRRLKALLPADADAAAALGRALRGGGRLEKSTDVLTQAADRFPDSAVVWIQCAHTALTRGDLRGSRTGWTQVAKCLPGNRNAADWIARLNGRIAAVEEGASHVPCASRESTPELVAILNDVTSLGRNCEVGFLQRFYGSEPVGMFRWARVTTSHLLQAIQERFAGFGTAEQTRLDELDGRYFTVDTRFEIRSHTGVHTHHQIPDNLLEREGRKHRKLRDLLLHQMQTGSKVFIHQAPVLTDQSIRKLTDAMRAIGPVTALFVRLATEPGEVGRIEEPEDGIFVACIDRLGLNGPAGNDPSELWLRFCTIAHGSLVARSGSSGSSGSSVREAHERAV